jgi:hypothetical protein
MFFVQNQRELNALRTVKATYLIETLLSGKVSSRTDTLVVTALYDWGRNS